MADKMIFLFYISILDSESNIIFFYFCRMIKKIDRFIYIFLSLVLIAGCTKKETVTERTEDLCGLLFGVGLSEVYCDSVVLLSAEFPATGQLDVLLAAIRSDAGANYQDKVEIWLKEAGQIAPKERQVEVEMERICYDLKKDSPNLGADEREEERIRFCRLEQEYHLTSRQRVWFLYNKASLFVNIDVLSAWMWMREALTLMKKEKDPILEIIILEKFANMATKGGDYDLGISLWKEAFRIRKQENLFVDEWIYWMWMQNNQLQTQRYPEALRCCRELIKIAEKTDDKRNVLKVLYGMVDIYQSADSLSKALDVLRLLETCETKEILKAGIWGKMAGIFEKQGKNDSLKIYYRDAVTFWEEKFPNKILNKALPEYTGYARVLWNEGHKREAVKLLEKAVIDIPDYIDRETTSIGGKHLLLYLEAVMQLAEYYRECGEPHLSMNMLFRHDSLRNIYTESDVWYKTVALTERYRNQELKVRVLLQQEQLKFRKSLLSGVLLICVALAGIVLMLWKLYRQKRRRLDDIYRKQKEVERLERQMDSGDVVVSQDMLLFKRLEKLVLEQELFRKPDLSLDDLCPLVESNRSYVSGCVNKGAGMNFSAWINKIRVDYVLKMIGDGTQDLADLYEKAGFASSTSFYRNFKLVTRMTPKQYMNRERKRVL